MYILCIWGQSATPTPNLSYTKKGLIGSKRAEGRESYLDRTGDAYPLYFTCTLYFT